MRVLVFMALMQTFACKDPSRPRTVNLALETVVEFDQNENSADVQIIDKARRFLDRVKFAIDRNKGQKYRRSLQSGRLRFTDFVKHALGILSTYDERDLENIISIADKEVRKYHYKGCKFNELEENPNLRRFVASKIASVKNAPAKHVKDKLKKMLRSFQNDNLGIIHKVVQNYLNDLYDERSENKFRDVLDKLASYGSKTKRSNVNLNKVVRDGLRSVIFDHYSGLDDSTRRDIKVKLETYWQDLDSPGRSSQSIWNLKPLLSYEKPNVKHRDEDGSASFEMSSKTKHHKRERHEHKRDKTKSKSDENSTKRHVTYMTLYPEPITMLEKAKRKTKSPKSHLREEHGEHDSKFKNKKKHREVKKIIAEHQAVINVESDTVNRMIAGLDQFLIPAAMEIKSTTKRHRSSHHNNIIVKKRAFYRKHESYESTRRIKKSRKAKDTPTLESEDGLSISFEDSNVVTKSLRKSNYNDTLNDNDTTNHSLPSLATDENVIKRINDLEKELRVVKAQMKITQDNMSPTYGHLNYWTGTAKDPNDVTLKSTTKTTATIPTTTTATPKTTVTTTILTPLIDSTFDPVFRSQDTSESTEQKEIKEHEIKKSPEKDVEKEPQINITDVKPKLRAGIERITLNNSADIDYLNDLSEPEMNITAIKDLERFLNETKPIENDDQRIVREKILDQLKGILPEKHEEEDTTAAALSLPSSPSTSIKVSTDLDITTTTEDPFGFLDEGDDI